MSWLNKLWLYAKLAWYELSEEHARRGMNSLADRGLAHGAQFREAFLARNAALEEQRRIKRRIRQIDKQV